MKIKFRKNGSIKMTAQSKRDSLDLLKFLAGDDPDPWLKEQIAKKEAECNNIDLKK